MQLKFKGFTEKNFSEKKSEINTDKMIKFHQVKSKELIELKRWTVIFDRIIKEAICIEIYSGKGRGARSRYIKLIVNEKHIGYSTSLTDDIAINKLIVDALEDSGAIFVGKVNAKNINEALSLIIEETYPYCHVNAFNWSKTVDNNVKP